MEGFPSDWLRELQIAEFDEDASNVIAEYTDTVIRTVGPDSFRAFTELGAAEFALAPLYHSPIKAGDRVLLTEFTGGNPEFPVRVRLADAANAIFKTDCGPFSEHPWKSENEVSMWDVFTFAGDMSKVTLFGNTKSAFDLGEPSTMVNLIDALGKQYYEAGLGERVVDSGLLAATGIVWFAKAALWRGNIDIPIQYLSFASKFLA